MSFRRSRRALSIRPVSSLKHVIDTSGVVIAGANAVTDLAIQNDTPSTGLSNEVHTGSHIKAFFLNVQVAGAVNYGGVPRVYFYIYKDPSSEIIAPPVDAIGASTRRKFVIHQEMMMVSAQDPVATVTFPRTMFKGVVMLPKRYQRFGDADRLRFVIGNSTGEATGSTRWCIQCIYKEFF